MDEADPPARLAPAGDRLPHRRVPGVVVEHQDLVVRVVEPVQRPDRLDEHVRGLVVGRHVKRHLRPVVRVEPRLGPCPADPAQHVAALEGERPRQQQGRCLQDQQQRRGGDPGWRQAAGEGDVGSEGQIRQGGRGEAGQEDLPDRVPQRPGGHHQGRDHDQERLGSQHRHRVEPPQARRRLPGADGQDHAHRQPQEPVRDPQPVAERQQQHRRRRQGDEARQEQGQQHGASALRVDARSLRASSPGGRGASPPAAISSPCWPESTDGSWPRCRMPAGGATLEAEPAVDRTAQRTQEGGDPGCGHGPVSRTGAR